MHSVDLHTREQFDQIARALREQKPEIAGPLASSYLHKGFRDPLLYNARGFWFASHELHTEALADFRRAEELAPAHAAVKGAIAVSLVRLGRFEEAVSAFDQALELQPDSAVLHCRKGWAQEQAQDLVSAVQSHMRALSISPTNPEVLGRLAYLAARRGAWSEARGFAGRALENEQNQFVARLVLAMADVEEGLLEPADEKLSALLGDRKIAPAARAQVFYVTGDLRDRQDQIDEAFSAYRSAKLELAKNPYNPPSGANLFEVAERLAVNFAGDARWPRLSAPDEPSRHAFLLGFPRSGTTLLEQALGNNPAIATLQEKDTLANAVLPFMRSPDGIARLRAASEDDLAPYRVLYWEQAKKYSPDLTGKYVIDKGPIHTISLPVICRMFPSAKIIFALRDPRDVVLSCFRRQFELNPATMQFHSLENTARFYDAVMKLAFLYQERLGISWFVARHETFVEDFEGQLRALCAFLDLEWNAAMLEFAARAEKNVISTVSARQIARGLNREGIGRWRRYARQMAPVMPILEPWIEKFGYGE